MKKYDITKVDAKTEKETKYGVYDEADMKLITRGYKKVEDLPNMYSRKGSRYFFIVNEV